MIFLRAEQDTDRRVVARRHFVLPIPTYIRIELTEMFVGKFVDF
jgi:hypothetical protein